MTDKITLATVGSISQNPTSAATTINSNFSTIQTAFDNTLSRDGTQPNTMTSNLDMNNFHILNLPQPSSDNDPVRKIDLTNSTQVTNLLHTASSTSNTIGTGSKTFTVPSGLGFFTGQYILIQNSLDSTDYMVGRVTSYATTTLVVNVISTGGGGTFSNWTIDLSGAPGSAPVYYDTVVNAIATNIPASQTFLMLAGYNTSGDGGNGLYKKVLVTPSHAGFFTSADGAIWELCSRDVTPEMFNAKGDGVTDDRAAIQNAIHYTFVRGNGNVICSNGSNYSVHISGSVTDLGLILEQGTSLYLNGSTISINRDGNVYGIRPQSHTQLIGPGTVQVTVHTSLDSVQDIYLSAISIGAAYSEVTNPNSLGNYINAENIRIKNLTVINNSPNDANTYGIAGIGGMNNIVIEDIEFPDSAKLLGCINFDWGTVGTGGATIALTKPIYLAGNYYTVHPHNIDIRGIKIGNLTNTGILNPIRISGCYQVHVENVDIQQVGSTQGAALFHTGGDQAFEFVGDTTLRNYGFFGNTFKNITVHLTLGNAISIDTAGDNLANAVAGGYTPIGPVIYPSNVIFENVVAEGPQASSAGTLVLASACTGVTFRNCKFTGGFYGINLTGSLIGGVGYSATYCNVENCIVNLSWQDGIVISNILGIGNNTVRNCFLYNNGISATGFAGVNIQGGGSNKVINSLFGAPQGESFQYYGVNVGTSATNTFIQNNTVTSSVNVGFNLATSTSYGVVEDFYGNFVAAGLPAVSGINILPLTSTMSVSGVPIRTFTSVRASLSSATTPTTGTWNAGDKIFYADPIASDFVGTVCVTSGLPGVWKKFGATSA